MLAQADAPALFLQQVQAGYGDRVVLRGGDAALLTGQAVALLGPNGSGKSTLLKVVLGLLTPWRGRVELFGQPPARLNRRQWQLGYVPQLREVDRAFPATVLDLALQGRVGRLGLFRRLGRADRELALDALQRVGLADQAGQPFGALSGGQQQRVFLARALVQEPDLLVLDEPVAGVDTENRARVGAVLAELRARGVPLLVATHDLDELEPLSFDLHWTLANGQLRVDLPGESHAPHAPDHHEPLPEPAPPRRRSDPFGLRPRLSGWG